ncbi:MAG TPA: DUF177 domain-containing protein [bacterium]|nr:DUF177 domain-containing protein [bacterium]
MIVDVLELAEGIHPLEFTEGADLYDTGDERIVIAEPVRFSGSLEKTGEKIFVGGKASTRLSLTCVRCLDPFSVGVAEDVSARYLPEIYEESEKKEKSLHGEDLDVSYYAGTSVDLTPALRDHLLLAVPIAPLCRDDCQGLCAVCGERLAAGAVHAHEEQGDPRLSALSRLKI